MDNFRYDSMNIIWYMIWSDLSWFWSGLMQTVCILGSIRSCAGMWAASWSRISRWSLGQWQCGDWRERCGSASSFSIMAVLHCSVEWFFCFSPPNESCVDRLDLTQACQASQAMLRWLRILIWTEWLATLFLSMWSDPSSQFYWPVSWPVAIWPLGMARLGGTESKTNQVQILKFDGLESEVWNLKDQVKNQRILQL